MNLTLRQSVVVLTMVCSASFFAYVAWNFERLSATWQGPLERQEILFTGDVFLGRQVEERMKHYGSLFPFEQIADTLRAARVTVINFESAVAEPHKKTPHFGFQFSTDTALLPILSEVEVTHASLANNHAFDHGVTGYQNARAALEEVDVTAFGTPGTVGEHSLTTTTVGGETVALVALMVVDSAPDFAALEELFDSLATTTTHQAVVIHWGVEYSTTHSSAQERVARELISLGADIIIGHHPHVVQDIAVYDGVPVFYSLGNLVFDQYFSEDVQQGLLVSWNPAAQTATLMPTTTIGQPIQPRPMNKDEQQSFLEGVALRSDPLLAEMITNGTLRW